jgi:DNA-binding CsgD family transcriptional regulator
VGVAVHLERRDLDGLLRFVQEAAASNAATPFELTTIDLLTQLVRADQAGYYDYRSSGVLHEGRYEAETFFNVKQPGAEPPWSDDLHPAWWRWPLNDFRNCRRVQPVRFSDGFASSAERHRCDWYQMTMRPTGIEHEIDLWLPAPQGTVRAFFFVREKRRKDFSERDRTMLTILRPHLIRIRERWQRQHHPATLTRRESELLDLVREGLTNAQIADRLVISPATVRAHLSNLFQKLGVHTRTAAATHDFAASAS